MKKINFILFELIIKRRLIYDLTRNDLKSRYAGSYLGILWAFINPFVTILILWFVFQNGFKSPPTGKGPYFLWLTAGMIPWNFIMDAMIASSNSIVEKSYLVKKIVFRVSLLPLIKILAAIFIHFFLIIIIAVFFMIYGYFPDIYYIQILYYMFAASIFIMSISMITASVTVFIKDMNSIVQTLMQMLFWGTPVFWSLNIIPENFRIFFLANPFYYIIEGYRDSFINKIWFWQKPEITLYFWAVTAFIFLIGSVVFRRLRPHFADVL